MGAGQTEGYIVVRRDDPLWSLRPSHFKIALTCIRLANWRESQWFDGQSWIALRRGEFVTSQENLAAASGPDITRKMVRGALEVLRAKGWVADTAAPGAFEQKSRARGRASEGPGKGQARANPYTRIYITDYDSYCPSKKNEGQARASEGPAEGERRATGEEVTRSSVISLSGDHMSEQNSELEGGDKVQHGRPRLEPSAEAYRLADFLRTELLAAQPTHRIGRREWGDDDAQRRKWAIALDRMVRGDGRDWRRSAEHVRWVFREQTGDVQFVVESPGALRKKWDAIERTRRRRKNGENLSAQQLADMAREKRDGTTEGARVDGSPEGILSADGNLGGDGASLWDRLARPRG